MGKPKYRIYFTNFQYFSYNEAPTLDEAIKAARSAGFQSSIYSPDNEIVASYCPIGGVVRHR